MIRSLLLLTFFLVLSLVSGDSFAQQVFKTTSKSVIGYLEYLPDGYNSNSKDYPLVIFLHGKGEKGPNSTDPKKLKEGEAKLAKLGPPMHVRKGTKFPFILISPQLKSNYGGWPTSYVMEVLEHVQKTLRVDKSRIYITGLSMGGYGTWTMIQQYPEIFAAAAPVCGGGSTSKAKAIADENLPVWAFHGDADNVVPYSRSVDMVNAINNYNPNPRAKLSIYKGVKHDAWERAYRPDHSVHNPNVYEWFMSYKNDVSDKPQENAAPVADAGPDKTITADTKKLVINGSGKDADGTIISYTWTKVSGGDIQLSNANSKDVEISGFSEGTYRLKLTVADNRGAKGSDEVTIKVEAAANPPVVNAGSDKTIQLPQNSVVLEGEGRAQDGKITSYVWTKIEGGQAELSNDKTPELTVKNLTEGKYRFRLTVKTDKNQSASDDVDVTVRKADTNKPPVANAGKDQTIDASTKSLVLKGSGSDEDGKIASYKWSQTSGATLKMEGANSPELKLSEYGEGKYTFRLTVTDDDGAQGTDQVNITVQRADKPPVVDAGKDKVIKMPETATLLTGTVTVENGEISKYKWSKVDGADVTLSGENTRELSVKGLKPGKYKFRLYAESDRGLGASDEVLVTVLEADRNSPPVAEAGDDRSIKSTMSSFVLNGKAADSDGSVVSYTWTKISGGSVTMKNAETKDLTISGFKAGKYVFRLTVKDDKDATGSDDVMVIVNEDAKPPVADAGKDQTIQLPGNTAVLKGSGKVESGSIATYRWSKISGGKAVIVDASVPETEVKELEEGVYVFRLEVKSDQGLAAKDDVQITVRPPANKPPVANAGKDVVTTADVEQIVLEGTGTDEDGEIMSFAWKQVSGGEVEIAGANQSKLTVRGFAPGSYVFRLTVKDDDGAAASDDILLKVNEQKFDAPVVNAGSDKSITLPRDHVVLNGSADAKGRAIKSLKWSKQSGETVTMSNQSSASVTIRDLQEGSYIFRLTATCEKGLTAFDEIKVVVKPAEETANDKGEQDKTEQPDNGGNTDSSQDKNIIVDVGDDLTVPADVPEVELNGIANSDFGDIVAYSWTQVSGVPVVIENGYEPSATIKDLVPGVIVFELEVRDNTGRTATGQVTIIVEQPADIEVNTPIVEEPEVLDPDSGEPFGNIDLTAGRIPTPEKFGVVVFNDRGELIFKGRWDKEAFDRVFSNPGLYIYHILAEGKRIKAGKIMVQAQ